MSSPVIDENVFLLYSLIMGIAITFLYDILRSIRRVFSHNGFFVSMEDLLFWLICAVSVFYLMHTQSNGTLRWFAVSGAVIGMFLYRKTISPFFVKWTSFLIQMLVKGIRYVLTFLKRPFVLLAGKGKKAGNLVKKGGHNMKGFLKKRLTALKKLLRITLCKQ